MSICNKILNKPLSIFRTGVRDNDTAAVVVALDNYTIKTIFGDGTVELEIQDPETRKFIPDLLNFDEDKEKVDVGNLQEEENVCTLDSVSDNDIVLKDKKFDLSAEELNELLNMNKWDDLTDSLKKKIMMIE